MTTLELILTKRQSLCPLLQQLQWIDSGPDLSDAVKLLLDAEADPNMCCSFPFKPSVFMDAVEFSCAVGNLHLFINVSGTC